MTSQLDHAYASACAETSDINEHVPTFYEYGKQSECVVECGVRTGVSTWGFLRGLRDNGCSRKKFVGVDLNHHPNVDAAQRVCRENGITTYFIQGNDLHIDLPKGTDTLFIDTWHVYGHLKRELAALHKDVRKFIIMHDTTVDAHFGESIRSGSNTAQQALESGYPENEIRLGLWPAVQEFLAEHGDEWELRKRYVNNNGLTILARKTVPPV
jgi:cephalosporin hydroxylase